MVAPKRQINSFEAWASRIYNFLRGYFAQDAMTLYIYISINIYKWHLCRMSITDLQIMGATFLEGQEEEGYFHRREVESADWLS